MGDNDSDLPDELPLSPFSEAASLGEGVGEPPGDFRVAEASEDGLPDELPLSEDDLLEEMMSFADKSGPASDRADDVITGSSLFSLAPRGGRREGVRAVAELGEGRGNSA